MWPAEASGSSSEAPGSQICFPKEVDAGDRALSGLGAFHGPRLVEGVLEALRSSRTAGGPGLGAPGPRLGPVPGELQIGSQSDQTAVKATQEGSESLPVRFRGVSDGSSGVSNGPRGLQDTPRTSERAPRGKNRSIPLGRRTCLAYSVLGSEHRPRRPKRPP